MTPTFRFGPWMLDMKGIWRRLERKTGTSIMAASFL